MVSKKLTEADSNNLEKGFELGNFCIKNGIFFIVLTASGTNEVRSYGNGSPVLHCR